MANPLTPQQVQQVCFDLALAGLHAPAFPPPPLKARLWSRNEIIDFVRKHYGRDAAKVAAWMPLFTLHSMSALPPKSGHSSPHSRRHLAARLRVHAQVICPPASRSRL